MEFVDTPGVALVTGAAKGIGRGIANALAAAGTNTIIFADNDENGARAPAAVSKKFATAENYQSFGWLVDLADQDGVEISIDYLVNGAVDVAQHTSIPGIADYDCVQSINTRGTLLVTQAVVNVMEKQEPRTFKSLTGFERELGRGCIVNVVSTLSFTAVPAKVAYIASKHAVLSITKATAQDIAPYFIHCSAICPRWVCTSMYVAELQIRIRYCIYTISECAIWAPPVADFIKAAVPLSRPIGPEEVGDSVMYLCSPASSYVNRAGLPMHAGIV
ncbi:NAD(P)-binding protein [Zopfia rhizophila CBS 207.26]|uniref:NAD(P)-binding protein n=1 Tax=Zopfia rhizophila CBS 207.26 TaxID=1314779 RepID=A0A6A6F0X4_9PEZI|nr:NAD(P)-binding protein [Zopfia rhizophila CBS 207.26]